MKVKEQYRRKQRYGSVLQRRRTLLQQRLAQIGYMALRSSHPPQLHGDITRWASTSELAQRRSTGLLHHGRAGWRIFWDSRIWDSRIEKIWPDAPSLERRVAMRARVTITRL